MKAVKRYEHGRADGLDSRRIVLLPETFADVHGLQAYCGENQLNLGAVTAGFAVEGRANSAQITSLAKRYAPDGTVPALQVKAGSRWEPGLAQLLDSLTTASKKYSGPKINVTYNFKTKDQW